jgi:RNA polymerase sigma factor (sigma-70 family)
VTDENTERDAGLAIQARHGDRRAFSLLMQHTKEPLYRFVRRYIANDDDAYDIVQESYIAAWGALKRYDERRPFATWLRAIALNKCRDFGRRNAVRTRLRVLFSFLLPTEEPAPSTEAAPKDDRLRRLDAAIAALPAFYKEPLLLTAIIGLSQKDAASQLNTSVKAIEMRVRRARQKLQQELSQDEQPKNGSSRGSTQ